MNHEMKPPSDAGSMERKPLMIEPEKWKAVMREDETISLRRKLELSQQREVSLETEIGELVKVNEMLRSQLFDLKRRQMEPAHD